MYDVPQLIPRSPQSTRSKASSTSTRQSPLRLPSPSKIRATPSKTRQTSPRKSPAKSRVFHAMSPKAVSFTPEKTKQPPRAWERRPATPFVPRDDKQKIWKRIPLGEIGIEPNRPANVSRREQEATKDYVRVVKKMKVGHSNDDEDKENVSAGAKMNIEDEHLKRRVRFDSRFVTTKTEEDLILGSPKKKLRAVTDEGVPDAKEEMFKQVESEDEEEATENVKEDEAVSSSHQVAEEGRDGQNQGDIPDAGNELSERAEPATSITEDLLGEHSNDDDSTSEEVTSDAFSHEIMAADAHGPGSASNNILCDNGIDVQVAVANIVRSEESSEQAPGTPEHDIPEYVGMKNQDFLTQSMELDEPLITSEQPSAEVEDDVTESPTPMPEEPRSSSPPTVLPENVIIDELESRNALRLEASIDQTSPADGLRETHESENITAQDPASRRISDDEAAFLRNFVSTSKAERAARERRVQEMLSDEPVDQQVQKPQLQEESHETSEEVAQRVEEIPNLGSSTAVSIENISSSPLRRSKRAVITSIPRPQTLLNAIQLKRANGNEFIFTANKASSMVNVAVVTRSNTKRNKGSALNVPERLEQLLAGEKAAGDNGEQTQTVGDVTETSEKSSNENVHDKVENKKRKREAKDGGNRTKKVLRWNDENLVSYQEVERNVDGWEDIEDSSQENNTTTPHERDTADAEKHVKLTLTMTLNGSNSSTQNMTSTKDTPTSSRSSTTDSKESSTSTLTSSQNKFRRVRRGTSGTVNGTPGPKTRSRRVAEDEEKDANIDVPIDTNGSVEDSTAVTAAITSLAVTTDVGKGGAVMGKKSRMPMPVPVASGLGVRIGAAASASVRGTGTVAKVGAVTPGPGHSEVKRIKETSKSQVQTPKDDGKGDLLGKRRLRVRP